MLRQKSTASSSPCDPALHVYVKVEGCIFGGSLTRVKSICLCEEIDEFSG